MWHSLKKHIGLLTNIVADYGVILQLSKLSIRPTCNLSTSIGYRRNLKLMTACSGVSKFLNSPQIEKGIIGEDAFFIQSQDNCDVIGVADGVGGWSSIGVDPSIFSSNLMRQCKRIVEKDDLKIFTKNSPLNISTPVKLLEQAYRNMTLVSDQNLIGSATACILCFDYTTNNLLSANLGDSGFVIVRNGKIIHRSVEQQHYFNCPYQLAIYPEGTSRSIQQDSPSSAFSSSVKLIEGDLICLATDGLWDNLNDRQLTYLLDQKTESYEDLMFMVKQITKHAVDLSLEENHLSPFAISAKLNNKDYLGGKPDDITVILARVTY